MDDGEVMDRCIELAREALERGDHPFSAVLVRDGEIFAEGQNRVNSKLDPTAHAETEVIREACKALETLDLSGYTLYASGEPCWMCSMIVRVSRIERVVIGELSRWPTGGYRSRFPILTEDVPERFGPVPEVVVGVRGAELAALLDEAGWSTPPR
ncbi:MAG: nucleoside deaminase [Chloroflexota bacterium]